MTNTLTFQSGGVVTPLLIDGWEQTRPGGARAHALVGGGVDYTHAPRKYRAGTLTLIFASEAEALALDALVKSDPFFDLASDELTAANGRFVPVGDVVIGQDDEAREVWVASLPVSEDA
jgi:hypothetical protein